MKPLSNTVRVVDWDELPSSARDVPSGFSPLAEGVLMAHQVAVLKLTHTYSIVAVPKGRRTGITFAVAQDSTLVAASSRAAGGDNIFYIGDTKEKGLEFIGYCAKFSRVIAEAQGQGVSSIEEFLFEDQDEKGNTRNITAYRIRFNSGFQITALSSRPANIRGLQGIVIIDEAAFHADVQGVLDAATALLIWGGRIVVISSHNGKNNPFNQFCRDIEEGRYGDDAAVITVTFDDAVKNGLYERVCMMQREEPTAEGKERWYKRIRAAYGPRKAAMRQELDAIPSDGSGVAIPGIWIDAAMREGRPVVRLSLDEGFVLLDTDKRIAWCEQWIKENIDPLIASLDPEMRYVLAQDFARHRDFSIIAPLAITNTLRRSCPFIIEMSKVPVRQQEQILWHIIRNLPNFCGAAIDATGPGLILAEYTADEFGHDAIHQVSLNRSWYGLWMPKMIQWFEDGVIDLPADINIEQDLRAIVDVDGIYMVPAVRKKDLKEPELYRHGDAAIALVLACYASLNQVEPAEINFKSIGRRASSRDMAYAFGRSSGRTNFGGF